MARTAVSLSLALVTFTRLALPIQAGAETFDQDLGAFDTQLEALRREHKLPGLAVAVVKDGKQAWAKGYGFADADREVPITPDTPFWIASVTKTFLGLLFLQLEADGKISLNDQMSDVPKFEDLCEWLAGSTIPFGRDLHCKGPITVRTVLNHTSNGTPGTRFLYNPIFYSRLSRYIEHKNGRSVDLVEGRHNTMAQLVEAKILKPAGMRRTLASQWDREKALVYFDMAEGFGVSPEREFIKRRRPDRHLAGGAGIVSTVEDLARYDIALDSGALASKAVMEKLFTPAKTPDGTVLPYAFGWYVQEYRGEKLYWHSGWDDEAGFSALYLKVPAKHLAIILLANGEGLWWNNPLDKAEVEKSPFARAFLDRFVFRPVAEKSER